MRPFSSASARSGIQGHGFETGRAFGELPVQALQDCLLGVIEADPGYGIFEAADSAAVVLEVQRLIHRSEHFPCQAAFGDQSSRTRHARHPESSSDWPRRADPARGIDAVFAGTVLAGGSRRSARRCRGPRMTAAAARTGAPEPLFRTGRWFGVRGRDGQAECTLAE